MSNKLWVVYLVRCSDNTLYCGIAKDLNSRLIDHNSGKGAKYTRSRRPVELVGVSPEMTKSEALKLEYRIKKLPADKKLIELTGKENGMTLKQDLKTLQNEIKKLEKNLGKLTKAMAAVRKPKSKKSPKPKPVPAETPKETAVGTAPTKITATNRVLDIIREAENGVHASTLIKETGFKDQKVRNILTRIFKEGKVKRLGRGIYVVA
jgi:putative endonuclease